MNSTILADNGRRLVIVDIVVMYDISSLFIILCYKILFLVHLAFESVLIYSPLLFTINNICSLSSSEHLHLQVNDVFTFTCSCGLLSRMKLPCRHIVCRRGFYNWNIYSTLANNIPARVFKERIRGCNRNIAKNGRRWVLKAK